MKEIERKFLMDHIPTELDLIGAYRMEQGYISIDPEIRIRKKTDLDDNIEYKLEFKTNGDLYREEIKLSISKYDYIALLSLVPNNFLIKKDYYVYRLPSSDNLWPSLKLEFSIVDKGTTDEFMYAEIEFYSIEQAESFIVPSFFGKEVTYDPYYKMKNYWARTRLLEDD